MSPRARRDVVSVAQREEPQPMRFDRYHDRPELYVESDRLARILAGIIAVLIIIGVARWGLEAYDRVRVPDIVRPIGFRVPQLTLAIAGIAAAVVEIAYACYFALTGHVWRRWREVTIIFAAIVLLWTVVWLLDRFVLDALFLE